MSVKIEIEWNLSKDKSHPDKPGDQGYEQIPCFVIRRGEVKVLQWNCEHLCWDREDGDDYECDVSGVTAWAIIPTTKQITTALGI